MPYKTHAQVHQAIANLAAEFEFFQVYDILKTPEDFKVISQALTNAFKCVPSCTDFPSQQEEAASNEAAALASFNSFLDQTTQS